MSDSDQPTNSIILSDRSGRTRYTRQYKPVPANHHDMQVFGVIF